MKAKLASGMKSPGEEHGYQGAILDIYLFTVIQKNLKLHVEHKTKLSRIVSWTLKMI